MGDLTSTERVSKVIPSHYVTLRNNKSKTAREVFDKAHKEQLENARTWIKETTQSCSTVSALVATVVFAAAYTVPGGSDENGKPNFIESPYFLVFTVSDVLSLASSLTSLDLSSSKTYLGLHLTLLRGDNDHAILRGNNFDTHSVGEKVDSITPFHCCIPSSISICNNAIPTVRLVYGLYSQHSQDDLERSAIVSYPLPTMWDKAPSMEKPYRAAMIGDWKNIIHHYQDRPMDLSFPVTLDEDTALHIAVYSKQAQPLQDLLEIVKDIINFLPDIESLEPEVGSPSPEMESPSPEMEAPEQMKFLKRKNRFGNTALHEATICGNYEAVTLLVRRCPDLLKQKNKSGETPLFTAAGFGEAEIDQKGRSALQYLADMPSAFKSGYSTGIFETLLYCCLPVRRHHKVKLQNGDQAGQGVISLERNQRGGLLNCLKAPKVGFWPARLERQIKHRKKSHGRASAKQRKDKQKEKKKSREWTGGGNKKGENELSYSGQPSEITSKSKELEVVQHPTAQPSVMNLSLTSNEQISLLLTTGNGIEEIVRGIIKQYPHAIKKLHVPNSSLTERIPLFLATRNGIEEIVWETIKLHPHAVEKLNDKGQSILDVAVMHRQKKIFSLVKQQKVPLARLHRVIDNKGNTLLHHVANMKYYSGGTKPGPALKLQEELQWFEQVQEVIPSHYATLTNDEGKTAGDLFNATHKEQLENAQKWIKETTQSCSTVAALVATVVFAAAYTVPGGSDENGTPNFITSPYFLVFTVSDVLSLASSLTSLVVFLSLLTSPFELKEFHFSLPRKLLVGFTFLFFAVITTMLSFGATILILIQSERKLTTLLHAAFLPVLVFAIMQFRLYVSFMGSTYNIRNITGKTLPRVFMATINSLQSIPVPLPIFDGTDYDLWETKMKTLFKSQNLWDIVNEPQNTCISNEAQRKDASALYLIQQSLAQNVFRRITKAKTAKKAWDMLRQEFLGDSKGEYKKSIPPKPWDAAVRGDWKSMMVYYRDEEPLRDLSSPVTHTLDTVLHLAVHDKCGKQCEDFLEIGREKQLPDTEFLEKKNIFGNTALHEATIYSNNKAVRLLVDRCPGLVEMENNFGETPLFTAAGFAETEIVLEFLIGSGLRQCLGDDGRLLSIHREREDGLSILSAAIIGQKFETALLLLELDKSLASSKDKNKISTLQLLAEMPTAFKSGSVPMGIFKRFIYNRLPVPRPCEVKSKAVSLSERKTMGDVESGQGRYSSGDQGCGSEKNQRGGLLNYLKIPTGGWLERLRDQKRKHVFAFTLAESLIENDKSLTKATITNKEIEGREMGGRKNKKAQIELICNAKDTEKTQIEIGHTSGTSQIAQNSVTLSSLTTKKEMPLFTATRRGVKEIVDLIIKLHPHVIDQRDKMNRSILDVAVTYRRRKIFDIIVKGTKLPLDRMLRVVDNSGNTLLHHVADMKKNSGVTQPGPALQLQEELKWFEKVEKVIPPHYVPLLNKEGKTARECFEIAHEEQLEKAQLWIKETSQSCSTVAALVSTVVFAAAYTVPGGSDDKGKPIFINSPYFLIFTVTDVVSLASSLTSLVMFLSLLTSPFELQEFHTSLPRKLIVGLFFLFFSVLTSMISFGATILILIQTERKFTTLLLSIASFLPVFVFGILQFRMFVSFMSSTLNIRKIKSSLVTYLPWGKRLRQED
uniref:PGG domain-containing protein n=1 Tax=Salix viminalis TaxID=40686 RepID=A0A6N2M0G8_SALVM